MLKFCESCKVFCWKKLYRVINWEQLSEGHYLDGNYPGLIIGGQLSRRHCLGANFLGDNCPGGNCLGAIIQAAIVLELKKMKSAFKKKSHLSNLC